MAYRGGYKYQLACDYRRVIPVYPTSDIVTPFYSLSIDGELLIRAGYAWDGASGPTWDTLSSMKGSLIHDVLYQAMRQQLLDHSWRSKADDLLFDICIESGMFRWRAWLWRKAVGAFADGATTLSY
jgi:hypothetical protein